MSRLSVIRTNAASGPRRPGRMLPGKGGGFTLMEVMVSTAVTSVVVSAMLIGSMSLHRALHVTETYTGAYSDQRRLTDYISRDIRRAVGVAVTDGAGARSEVAGSPATVNIADRATLILTLPAYYRSDVRTDASYGTALEVVGNEKGLDYGTPDGIAPPVEIAFRKIFCAKEGCVCFVRQEAGKDEVIVRHAENLFVQIAIEAGTQSAAIKTWYRSSQIGPAPLVTTFDRMLLRNPPLTYRP